MSAIDLVWLVPALPLAAAIVNGLFGRRWLHRASGVVATAALGGSAAIGILILASVVASGGERHVVTLYEWIGVGDFHVNVSVLVDPLSALMVVVVTGISFL